MTDPGQVDPFGRRVPDPEVTVPRDLQLARWLWIGGSVVGLVRSVVQLSNRALLVSELRQMQPQLTQEQIDSATNSGIMFTLVFSLAILALYVALANLVVRGRNWARVVITVLGALSVLGTVVSLALGPAATAQLTGVSVSPLDLVFSGVVAAADIATLVFLYRPQSNRFFRDIADRRRADAGRV